MPFRYSSVGALAERLDRELVALLPPVVTKKALSDADVREGGGVQAVASDALRAASTLSFARPVRSSLSVISSRPKIEMVDDFEGPLLERISRQRGLQAPADGQMDVMLPVLLDEAVSRLLHAVVLKPELLHDER